MMENKQSLLNAIFAILFGTIQNSAVSWPDEPANIPGGARILDDECIVESLSFECNGEAMHEHWNDDETPLDAIKRLHERIYAATGEK